MKRISDLASVLNEAAERVRLSQVVQKGGDRAPGIIHYGCVAIEEAALTHYRRIRYCGFYWEMQELRKRAASYAPPRPDLWRGGAGGVMVAARPYRAQKAPRMSEGRGTRRGIWTN